MKKQTDLIALALLLMVVLGCGMVKNISKSSSTDFNPYKGKVNELLKPEISSGSLKFKSIGTLADVNSYTGSTEAKGFTYTQEGGEPPLRVDGALANYPTAAKAEAAIADLAGNNKGTLTKKNAGQRLISPSGETIAWTNGSLLCVVASGSAKTAVNFEGAVPF